MTFWSKRVPFQVDIGGIIDLMGSSLYSRLDTPIRELIQNAHDGIMRRRRADLTYQGRIDIHQNAQRRTLSLADDGIGLSPDEAEKYLGTLGIGITGMLRRRAAGMAAAGAETLIGQFGIGLFSAFMVAERLVVESRRLDGMEAVRWEAGPGTEIELCACDRQTPGTTVTLHLREEHRHLAEQIEPVEAAVQEYANFLPVPIYINSAPARANLIHAAWFDPTPDPEAIELELQTYFHEIPLHVIPIQLERPVTIRGALYVTPQRTPGFSGEATLAVTVQRMVISRKIQGLLPEWAPFLRGVLELTDCAPTASREDLVRDGTFEQVGGKLDELVFTHFEQLAQHDRLRLASLVAWHRYTLAGAALAHERLRKLLRGIYPFATSHGPLEFAAILNRSTADPILETEADRVIWYNPSRRQEQWINGLFAGQPVPCVHTLMSFEESLLAAMIDDARAGGESVDLRVASPGTAGFAVQILGVQDMEDAPVTWQQFLGVAGAKVYVASFEPSQPVMAFLSERRELLRSLDELKKQGSIPPGFQRMIDAHFQDEVPKPNEVLLNRRHDLVGRALSQSIGSPLASVLRLLVLSALRSAGMAMDRASHQQQDDDLHWIAEALWGAKP